MEQFIKKNWFKLIISLGVISVCASITYYFVFSIPLNQKMKTEQDAQERYLEQQEKCKEAGLRAYKEDSLIYGISNMVEPGYIYNKDLNLCLYSGGYKDEDPNSGQCGDIFKHSCKSYWERWVKNSFTNEKIIAVVNYTNNNGEYVAKSETINEFWDKHEQLMGYK